MGIITDAKSLEEPKNPDSCNVFKLYQLLGTKSQTEELREKYLAGNFGYGHAKTALFELIMEKFNQARSNYSELIDDTSLLETHLNKGEEKAKIISSEVISRVRGKLGLSIL